jgi:hypothetical protein
MRKFAERRILASPSLSKTLFPKSMVAKDCRRRMVTLPAFTQMTLDGAVELRLLHSVIFRQVIFRQVKYGLSIGYPGFFSRWDSQPLQESCRSSVLACEAFMNIF